MSKRSYPSNMIQTEGRIKERIAETAFRAILPNGKETVAFVEKKKAPLRSLIQNGDRVALTICPSDFDRARVDDLLN